MALVVLNGPSGQLLPFNKRHGPRSTVQTRVSIGLIGVGECMDGVEQGFVTRESLGKSAGERWGMIWDAFKMLSSMPVSDVGIVTVYEPVCQAFPGLKLWASKTGN